MGTVATDPVSMIRELYAAGLDAVEPRRAVRAHLAIEGDALLAGGQRVPIPAGGVIVVAVGKAAVTMARGALDVLGTHVGDGIILTKDGHAVDPPDGLRVFEAAHPVPDERGVAATKDILDLVGGLERGDVVLTLISGGGSALLEAPRDPVTLADLQATTDLLLRAGAPIQDLNAVRSQLSLVKGGGLRRGMGEATCISLVLSDVLGSDPATIASGPTVPATPDPARAKTTLERWSLLGRVPRRVIEALESAGDDDREAPAALAALAALEEIAGDVFEIIADNDMFVDGIDRAAGSAGLRSIRAWRRREGEARALGERFVAELDAVPEEIDLVLGGGEATVTVRGDGVGGRNTEFALAAAIVLDRDDLEWVVASLASDGEDGLVHGAGAIVDRGTVRRGVERGLDAAEALHSNDSGTFVERTGDLVTPGPTGTNVNDVYIALRAGVVRGRDGGTA